MSDTSVSGAGRRHFSPEDEEMLRRNESTNDIVKRDTKAGVEIHGADASWREVKEHQLGHIGVPGGSDIVKAAWEGGHFVGATEAAVEHGLIAFETGVAIETASAIASPVVGLALGLHQLAEAHEQGVEQNMALTRDAVHVAVVTALDLPVDVKTQRLDHDYKGVRRQELDPAVKMAETLVKDPRGLAVLQLHCDQGMHAARDLVASHKDVATFLRENPKVADAYVKDAAFHEGFNAYLSTKDRNALDTKLAERDGWYAQSHINVRV